MRVQGRRTFDRFTKHSGLAEVGTHNGSLFLAYAVIRGCLPPRDRKAWGGTLWSCSGHSSVHSSVPHSHLRCSLFTWFSSCISSVLLSSLELSEEGKSGLSLAVIDIPSLLLYLLIRTIAVLDTALECLPPFLVGSCRAI